MHLGRICSSVPQAPSIATKERREKNVEPRHVISHLEQRASPSLGVPQTPSNSMLDVATPPFIKCKTLLPANTKHYLKHKSLKRTNEKRAIIDMGPSLLYLRRGLLLRSVCDSKTLPCHGGREGRLSSFACGFPFEAVWPSSHPPYPRPLLRRLNTLRFFQEYQFECPVYPRKVVSGGTQIRDRRTSPMNHRQSRSQERSCGWRKKRVCCGYVATSAVPKVSICCWLHLALWLHWLESGERLVNSAQKGYRRDLGDLFLRPHSPHR